MEQKDLDKYDPYVVDQVVTSKRKSDPVLQSRKQSGPKVIKNDPGSGNDGKRKGR